MAQGEYVVARLVWEWFLFMGHCISSGAVRGGINGIAFPNWDGTPPMAEKINIELAEGETLDPNISADYTSDNCLKDSKPCAQFL